MAMRTPITSIVIDLDRSVLYTGTFGSGVFKSADGGELDRAQ